MTPLNYGLIRLTDFVIDSNHGEAQHNGLNAAFGKRIILCLTINIQNGKKMV